MADRYPIIFVGAGPGDPELITIKGMKALAQAEVLLYAGSLVSPAVLTWAPPEAEQVDTAALALEEIFLAANVHSAFTLGQVRGVVLLLAAQSQLPVFHYPPLVVKKAVVGYGQAAKAQVQLMVEQLLGQKVTDEHAADALAVGMCHLFHSRWLPASS